jgi:hypothetical protein
MPGDVTRPLVNMSLVHQTLSVFSWKKPAAFLEIP